MEFYTIGVYNSEERAFFQKIKSNGIDTFCDIRQRRGVRGAKYSFVNSTKLQNKLRDIGVKYIHQLSLAPTKEIRELQKKNDLKSGLLKRNRRGLGELFISKYNKDILEQFNYKEFFNHLEKLGSEKIVFFCVEENSESCHRSLVTSYLSRKFNYKITHL
ncbi:DUF488 domain-containing protein [Salinimicrobium tongyeongense]|uniref:DUF488 domain-containing protein n=1 Tax=Salinimicrobium tongyeongense TaxID=2809707 RepID=A0ABY6NUX4_9FLAO|nr:DUF488 domain-containing protein [Salinimicrobium tongyeongense]UZH56719.1 DUF488 domain-containing protein [Salinimicrobium tongyeongense]